MWLRMCGETSAARATAIGDGLVSSVLPVSLACWVGIGMVPTAAAPTANKSPEKGDCSIATGADSKIARQEQGESTWDPLNASELAPSSANGLIPSLIAWAKSQPPGNVAIVSINGYILSYDARTTNPKTRTEGRRPEQLTNQSRTAIRVQGEGLSFVTKIQPTEVEGMTSLAPGLFDIAERVRSMFSHACA